MSNKYLCRCAHPEEQHLRFPSWMEFGKLIALERQRNGFTQTDMAFAMRMNGEKVHCMDISRVENGIAIPADVRRLNAFLLALNLSKTFERRIRKVWNLAISQEF